VRRLGPMAAGTSRRRWPVLPVALAALLASYGNERPRTTYRSGAGPGQLWKCPECGRVERVTLRRPQCSGKPKKTHDLTDADLVEDEGIKPSDDLPLFE
jgi:hypothetical protein